ncbi:MAG: hypothetical protein ACKVZJ_01085 [Phycisphaerales bacterium]
MSEIDRVLRRASWRLALGDALKHLVFCLAAAAGGMVLLRLAQKVLGLIVDWSWAWVIAGAVAVAAAAVWTVLSRPGRLAVARRVDESAQLREALSTALCVRGGDDAWSKAAVEYAGGVARRVVVRDAIPVRVPRWWGAPVLLTGLFFLVGLLPQWDVLSVISGREAVKQAQAEVIEAKAQVQDMNDALKEQLAKVDEKLGAEEPPEAPKGPDEAPTAEDVRRDQVKKLTAIDERLNELRSGDQARAMDELKERLAELRQPSEASPQEMQDFAKALQRGDLKGAGAELTKLMEKSASGKLSPDQQKALEKAMKSMADQLKQLAEDKQKLEQMLNDMGLDKKLASDPEGLKKALENAKHLTNEQRQQAQKAAQSQKETSKKLNEMAKACEKCAQPGKSGQQGGKSGAGQMGELSDQMSELEMLEMKMNEMDLAQSTVKAQLQQLGQCMSQGNQPGKGGSQASNNQNWKNGPRGNSPGRANGGRGRSVEDDFELNKQRVKGPNQGGPIIGSEVVEDGEQIRGEARQAFEGAVASGQKKASEAIENKQVPREYQDAVKNYFGRLEKRAKPTKSGDGKAVEGEAPAAQPAPAPAEKDAEPAAEKK